MKHLLYIDTIVGRLGIAEDGEGVSDVFFAEETPPRGTLKETPLLIQAKEQIEEYLAGQRRIFNLPLAPAGTPFQMQVWAELQKIPYGETRSYGEIALAIGNPKACRAVGGANNKNPISIIIPCHRVIGGSGKLIGYGGGLWIKEILLQLERSHES